jgi:hypothetical protein
MSPHPAPGSSPRLPQRHIVQPLARRTMLKGLGVAMALPFLEAMTPSLFAADTTKNTASPRRMVIMMNSLSLLPQHFFPKKAGTDYEPTPYLNILSAHRQRMTVMSGVSLPQVDGGHHAVQCFLTGAAHPSAAGFRNTISLDVFAAEAIGQQTRLPFMPLMISASNNGPERGDPMSYTAAGVAIHGETKAANIYKKMFLQGDNAVVQAQIKRLEEERSILDMVGDRVKKINSSVSAADKAKLDQYYTSVRELEKRLVQAQAWELKPKPVVNAPMPNDITTFTDGIAQHRIMFDTMKLALSTDSTRIISIGLHMGSTRQNIPGVSDGTHPLSHHGNDPKKMEQLRIIEELQLKEIALFLDSLHETKEANGTLLDQTMVLFGSNMGAANGHTNVNLPLFLAGGGFKHGQHLAFDTKNNYPLTNLYVTMLQRLGMEVDSFSTGKGRMTGLEV